MPKYSVTVNRTKTVESSCEIEVTARDEESAVEKVESRIQKKLESAKSPAAFDDAFDWQENSDDDQFEYEASEA